MFEVTFLLWACFISSRFVSSEAIDLEFSYVVSSSAELDPVYGVRLDSTLPAVDLALEYINNNSTLLPGYHLSHRTIEQRKCGRGQSLDSFFQDVISTTNLGVVGSDCSQNTLSMAGVVKYWNIPQITCNTISKECLSSESPRYEHLFKLHPQPADYSTAVGTFVKHSEWTRLSIVSQEGDFYEEVGPTTVLTCTQKPGTPTIPQERGHEQAQIYHQLNFDYSESL